MDEREEEASNMGAVDIRIGHENHLAVPGLIEVEGPPRPGPDDLNDRRALGVLEHLRKRSLLHIEDLAPDGQQRLELRIPGHLRGAQGTVALHNEQLGVGEIITVAVDQFGRQRLRFQRILAPLCIAVTPRGDTSTHCVCNLFSDRTCVCFLSTRWCL